MSTEKQKTRDKLMYDLVKGERNMALGMTIVWGACFVAACVMLVAIWRMHKGFGAFVYDVSMLMGFGPLTAYWFRRFKAVSAAVKEIGPNPTGIDTCRTYSRETAEIISDSRKSERQLRQMWIGCGVLALTLLFLGGLMAWLVVTTNFKKEELLVIMGAIMLVGGIVLLSLTIKSFHEWVITRRLENMD